MHHDDDISEIEPAKAYQVREQHELALNGCDIQERNTSELVTTVTAQSVLMGSLDTLKHNK